MSMNIPDEAYRAADKAVDELLIERGANLNQLRHGDVAVNAAAPIIERAAQLRLLCDLDEAFGALRVPRRAMGDPAADGITVCIGHIRDLLKVWA